MIRIVLRGAALVFLLVASAAWAQEAAVTRRATELRETPSDSGRSLAPLPAQAALTRTEQRQGPWVQVRTAAGATGWVHLFDLGPATTTAASSGDGGVVGGALRSVGSLFGGGGSKPAQTSTTGIRGLGAEDLAQSQPDLNAVKQMEDLRVSDADARSFANRSAWKPAAVEPLPAAPAGSRASSTPARNPGQGDAP